MVVSEYILEIIYVYFKLVLKGSRDGYPSS